MGRRSDERRISIDQQKKIMVEILEAVDSFCRDKSIRYYLAYGTLLGAVRHKGFIPWDDDIDIMMLRNDYELFLHDFDSYSKRYKVFSYHKDKNYYMSHSKVIDTTTVLYEKVSKPIELGVFIDVFPIDYLGNSFDCAIRIVEKSKFYRNMLLLKNIVVKKNTRVRKNGNSLDPLFYKIAQLLLIPFSHNWIIRKQAKFVNNNCAVKWSKWIGSVEANIYGVKEVLPSDSFNECTELEFEGKKFKAPLGFDIILKSLYGDYMQLPPEEERTYAHGGEAYWR